MWKTAIALALVMVLVSPALAVDEGGKPTGEKAPDKKEKEKEDEKKPAPPGPDEEFVEKFGANVLLATTLAGYDVAAWYSSDELLELPREKLGGIRQWFCLEAEDGWHAVYGRLAEKGEKYERLFHFLVTSPKDVRRLAALEPGKLDVPLARALDDSGPRLKALPVAKKVRFNPYVLPRKEEIHVWALPQVTEDWVVVVGTAQRWRYSADGRKLLGHDSWDYGLQGTKADRETELRIGSEKFAVPSVGDLFTAARFGHLFEKVLIRSGYGISYCESGSMWVHIAKPVVETGEKPEGKDGGEDSGGRKPAPPPEKKPEKPDEEKRGGKE